MACACTDFPVACSKCRIRWAEEENARLRASIARVREICEKGAHDAAYDLRADILAEIGGES